MHDQSPREPRPAEPWPPAAASGQTGAEAAEAADLLRSFRDSLRDAGSRTQHEAPPPPGPEPSPLGTGTATLSELVDLALRLLEALSALIPPELRHHWQAIQREVLLAVRALIDHYLERLEGPPGPSPVEDIPIE